ncbi:Zn-finger in Ran binding protein [Onchocerca flexuosa]|uniref:Zinc finger Ran-binding domain-containing protein 2 n=1 Tax=Onchocerca flexuosa TaxID=387005 RepID=A0A238C3W4_9BILA|nr:Zn-finger in Ran binding protein [Onchocerca flexuosa]
MAQYFKTYCEMSSDDASRYLERQRQMASSVVTASGTHRRALREGEWACIDAKCAYINADRVSVCERCGKAKPRSKNRVGREIGKDAAEKSKGLFAAEDWACTKCGNVNWARRTACNICNAPKLGDLEVRTGYGGGYMDRQNVEYIEREDDEEFDEFGRKKKRRKLDNKIEEEQKITESEESAKYNERGSDEEKEKIKEMKIDTKEALSGDNDEEMEEEEEEEDENDADLDKYDLSADEFEVENLKAKIAARKAALASSTTEIQVRSESRCSSDCSCSCSGGECSCEESESEEERKRFNRDVEREKEKGDIRSKDRDSTRDKEKEKERDRERRDERERNRYGHSQCKENSPRRHHSSSVHRDKERR